MPLACARCMYAIALALSVLIGVALGLLTTRIPPEALRKGFAGFVLLMAVFVVYQQV